MNRWLQRWQASAANQFLCWWGSELLGFLPRHWRVALTPGRQALHLLPTEQGLAILQGSEKPAEPEPLNAGEDAHSATRIIAAAAVRKGLENPMLCLLVPNEVVLQQEIRMPLAAEENLRQVLGYEMDAHTPFTADQVYFDYRVGKRDAGSGQLHLDLVVAPRANIDGWLADARKLGVALDVVDVLQQDAPDAPRRGFNLLPPEQRPHRANRQLRLNLALAGLALMMVGVAMWMSLDYREQRLVVYQQAAAKSRKAAISTVKMRKQLADAVAGARFLLEKRRATPTMADILLAMTRALPDNTYAQLLRVRDGTVEVTGLSDSSSALIAKVAESPLFDNPSFRSSVTQDRRSGKERFNLKMTLVSGGKAVTRNRDKGVDKAKLQDLINSKLLKAALQLKKKAHATTP